MEKHKDDYYTEQVKFWQWLSHFFALLTLLAALSFLLSLIVGCSSSKNVIKSDTVSTPNQKLIKAAELKGLDIPEGDSTLLNSAWFKRISESYYLVTDTQKVVTKTEFRGKQKTKNYYNTNINSNNQVNSENKTSVKDKKDIDNSIKSNSDNTTKKNDTNSGNISKKNPVNSGNTNKKNGNDESRWKLKISSFPWWIWLIVALVAWLVYRYWGKVKFF